MKLFFKQFYVITNIEWVALLHFDLIFPAFSVQNGSFRHIIQLTIEVNEDHFSGAKSHMAPLMAYFFAFKVKNWSLATTQKRNYQICPQNG